MRLGQPVAPPRAMCQRGCGQALDEPGHHAHRCNRGRWRNARHNAVQHAIARILRRLHSFGVEVREHPVRVPEWDTHRRRAVLDLSVEGGPGGPLRYADVVVPHPVGDTNTPEAARRDGAAAHKAEGTKYTRYGRRVLPLAVESYGRWGSTALTWWRQLAKQVALADPALAHQGRWAIPALLHRWWAEIGVALQTANAEGVLASLGREGGAGAALEVTDAAAFELLLSPPSASA